MKALNNDTKNVYMHLQPILKQWHILYAKDVFMMPFISCNYYDLKKNKLEV